MIFCMQLSPMDMHSGGPYGGQAMSGLTSLYDVTVTSHQRSAASHAPPPLSPSYNPRGGAGNMNGGYATPAGYFTPVNSGVSGGGMQGELVAPGGGGGHSGGGQLRRDKDALCRFVFCIIFVSILYFFCMSLMFKICIISSVPKHKSIAKLQN